MFKMSHITQAVWPAVVLAIIATVVVIWRSNKVRNVILNLVMAKWRLCRMLVMGLRQLTFLGTLHMLHSNGIQLAKAIRTAAESVRSTPLFDELVEASERYQNSALPISDAFRKFTSCDAQNRPHAQHRRTHRLDRHPARPARPDVRGGYRELHGGFHHRAQLRRPDHRRGPHRRRLHRHLHADFPHGPENDATHITAARTDATNPTRPLAERTIRPRNARVQPQRTAVGPPGVRLVPLEVTLRNRFRFKMVVRRRSDLDHALAALKAENQTFTTRVEPRKVWCRKLLDDPRGGSFTFRIVWLVITVSAVVSAIVFFPRGLLVYVRDAWDFFKQYI
jgi:hypothetical protein